MNKIGKVYGVSKNILTYLDKSRNTPAIKANLAQLRNSINKDIGENIESLAFIFSMLPEDELGKGKKLNYFEEAILTSLQLYAIYQQGQEDSVIYIDEENPYKSLGRSLKSLRKISDINEVENKSIDLRFNSLVSSSDFKELKHHLRQMIKLLKSNASEKIDFSSLACDLYAFLLKDKNAVRINWARDYYWELSKNKGDINE